MFSEVSIFPRLNYLGVPARLLFSRLRRYPKPAIILVLYTLNDAGGGISGETTSWIPQVTCCQERADALMGHYDHIAFTPRGYISLDGKNSYSVDPVSCILVDFHRPGRIIRSVIGSLCLNRCLLFRRFHYA